MYQNLLTCFTPLFLNCDRVLSLGVTSQRTNPVQQENQLCLLISSAWAYPQWGSFHEEHCKRAWRASDVFVVLTLTHITPANKRKRKTKYVVLSMFYLQVAFAVCFMSLCFVVPLCICIYTSRFLQIYIFFYLIKTPVVGISWPCILGKECFHMPKSLGFGGLVKLFSSSRRSDRVYLGWCVWDLVWRLFRMQASRRSVKAH